jgi:hypothetical protein
MYTVTMVTAWVPDSGGGVFSTAHIVLTAAVTGVVATATAVPLLRGSSRAWEGLAIGVLAAVAVFLWRKSANMPQLNDDGLQGFSANDWLAPLVTFTVISLYRSVRPGGGERRFDQARAAATLAAFVVNVVTI